MATKIFCIGFHKTGTTSLASALSKLGYSVTGPNGWDDPSIAENVHLMTDELVEQYDAFQDNPWPILFKELDEKHPGSKFILTLRNVDAWMKSIVTHFGEDSTPMREWIYGVGSPVGNEEIYTARFNKHYCDVREYFKTRPNDLLEIDLANNEGWEKICPFLGKPIPSENFPHANKASEREGIKKWTGKIKKSVFNGR